MRIKPFLVEEWMNEYETGAKYNIAETCVDSISMNELFELTGEDKEKFLREFCDRRLTYGDIEGLPSFRRGVCRLYKTLGEENIVPSHGAAGANHHVFYSILEPGDRVVSIMPTYQQLYSIPESYGAHVHMLRLKNEDGYIPDLKELKKLVTPDTKMICINNPNNPTGALMGNDVLEEIVAVAERAGAYILCDEVYRHLTQEDRWQDSVADLYDKGISIGSMSKVFSMAGLRIGWMATRDKDLIRSFLSHRDYDLVSCGMFDEVVASLALAHGDVILARNKGIVRENLRMLHRWVEKEEHVRYTRPGGGTTALLHYDYDIPSVELCRDMYHSRGVFVTPGDCFEEPGSLRIGYAADRQVLADGLKAMSGYFRDLEKGKNDVYMRG